MQKRNRLTDLKNELIVARRKDTGEGIIRKFGMNMYTMIFKVDNQQGPTGYHMELCSMFCGRLSGRGVWGRIDTWICMAEPLLFT